MVFYKRWFNYSLVAFALTVGRLWLKSVRVQVICDPDDDVRVNPAGHIISLWHQDIIMACMSLTSSQMKVLVSHSEDGGYITRTINGLGFSTIRGSSKKGGAQAMREMLRETRASCVAITPDGPKGPPLQVKEGVTYLASRSGSPILAVGCAYGRAHRFGSWDRLFCPLPFSRVVVYLMPGLEVPRSADKQELDQYTADLQQRMIEAHERAEEHLAAWASTGKCAPTSVKMTNARKRCPDREPANQAVC
ncbi:hypothetical protein ETAA8_48510 [Anatilimnocola aggregata]|uniref:DUF374 domain-containing protein n=1 Tax=Anatilimnocola aggregata TaxID=2528021 RepID=A0A517YHN8_9BACT|nr:lysophospholipid acyltransferase family protein [Anatilimnocola aggregata]QDU29736.1 hypothetical protein ETAA8_48510 [Anatilimnocola aggregata]